MVKKGKVLVALQVTILAQKQKWKVLSNNEGPSWLAEEKDGKCGRYLIVVKTRVERMELP